MNRPTCAAALCTALALSACADDGPTGPLKPAFLGTTVAPGPANVLSAVGTVRAAGFDSVTLRFRSGVGDVVAPAAPFGPDSTVEVPVLGLRAGTNYTVETILYVGRSAIAVDTAEHLTGQLPAWLPAIGASGTDTTAGLVALSLPDGGVIVDNTGRVAWYVHSPAGTLNSFQAHANGTYTVLRADDTGVFHVLDVVGREIGTLTCVGRPTRFHDIMVLADGSRWMLCDETRQMDLSGVGGLADASVTATVIQHISPDGVLQFEWNAFDHFEITDLPEADRGGTSVNFTHGNAIELDPAGNLVVSFRSLSEITNISTTTGEVLWRLGGLANQFTILNDPKGAFERQHGVRLAGPAEIQFLDNGLSAPSRMVRYLVNPVQHTALLTMAFEDAPTTFTQVGGATDHYPNGHALVSFGRAGRVVEVDAAGNRAWELTGLDGMYVFRAERIRDLYHPATLARAP